MTLITFPIIFEVFLYEIYITRVQFIGVTLLSKWHNIRCIVLEMLQGIALNLFYIINLPTYMYICTYEVFHGC